MSTFPNNIIFATLNPTNSNHTLKNLYENTLASWRTFTLQYFSDRLTSDQQFLEGVAGFVSQKTSDLPKDQNKRITRIPKNKEELFLEIEEVHVEMGAKNFKEIHPGWLEKSSEHTAQLPSGHVQQQSRERFYLTEDDGFLKRWLKTLKRIGFFITRIPFFVANLFRKRKKELTYWKHNIMLQGIFRHYFVNDFIEKWQPLEAEINKEKCKLILQIKVWEEQNCTQATDPIVDIAQKWGDLAKHIENEINKWFESVQPSFEEDLELSGTWEYRDNKVSDKALEKDLRAVTRKWDQENQGWNRTQYALFEDWRSDLELDGLSYFIASCKHSLLVFFNQWSKDSHGNYLTPIVKFLTDTREQFKEAAADDLSKLISQAQYQVRKSLEPNLIQPLQVQFSKNALLNQIDRIEHSINEKTEELEVEFAATKTNSFDEPISVSEISKVSNYELISFEIQPWFEKKLESSKSALFVAINELLQNIGDVDDVVAYTLTTAGETLKKEDLDKDECQHIIDEGLDRAVKKTDEVSEKLLEVLDLEMDTISQAFEELREKIRELTENENVSSIRIRINKAKALQQSQAVKDRIRNFVQLQWKKGRSWGGERWQRFRNWQRKLRAMLIPSASSAVPSREVSNFLNESNIIIESLPLIYRSLYAIEPMTDQFLFEGREDELDNIDQAYEQWCQGKIGSVLVRGEKWSGLTSLINQAISRKKFKHPMFRHAFEGNTTEPSGVYEVFEKILKADKLKTTEDVIQYLNTSEKKIIVLEDLQNIYIRKMHGLKAFTELLEIIASTHRNVFWLTTITVYAGEYLEKCIQVTGFFSFPILMKDLTPEQISNLVIKRNRISGFKIIFEPGPGDLKNKKYNRMKEEEKQAYLRTRFFKELNAFARSNISMALLYWLLSTKEVDGSNIVISNFKKLDLTFLSLLAMEKVFVLQTLIIHDGLPEEQVSGTLSISPQKARMLLLAMEEDGIIYEEDGSYLVNLLVYRNVIQMLKSKNLIY